MRIHLGLDSSYLAMCLHLTNGDSSVLNPLKRLRGPCFLNFVENDHDRLQLYHRVVGTIGGWQHSKGSILGPSLYLEAEVINRQQHWEKVHLSYWVHGIHDSSEQKLLDMRISCWTSNTLIEAKLVQLDIFLAKVIPERYLEACTASPSWKTTMTAFVMIHANNFPTTEY